MQLEPWQRDLITGCRVARFATTPAQGAPALLPVCYAFLEERFFIPIDEKPKSGRPLARLRNIDRDPAVSLLIDRYDDDWSQLAWLRVEGIAVAVDGGSFPHALAALRSRYYQYREMDLESRELIVIAPLRFTAWRWKPWLSC
jgi:PPOX class probable F420-dependent enzyme